MIELAMVALIETAQYQEEAVRIATAHHCAAHEIEGRSIESTVNSAQTRFSEMGYGANDISAALNGVMQSLEESSQATGSVQFCTDMFELLYPDG